MKMRSLNGQRLQTAPYMTDDMEHYESKIHGHTAVLILMRRAGYDGRLNNAARRILMILGGHADINCTSFPSIQSIARQQGVSRQAVRKQIIVLEELGYLEIEQRYTGKGGQTSNLYILNEQMVRDYVDK